jgi:hypothetical protein
MSYAASVSSPDGGRDYLCDTEQAGIHGAFPRPVRENDRLKTTESA